MAPPRDYDGNDLSNKRFDGKAPLRDPYFCNFNCKDGMREDRRARLVYGAHELYFDDDTTAIVSVETSSRFTRDCAYCNAHKTSKKKEADDDKQA